jgi:hypothetical protein
MAGMRGLVEGALGDSAVRIYNTKTGESRLVPAENAYIPEGWSRDKPNMVFDPATGRNIVDPRRPATPNPNDGGSRGRVSPSSAPQPGKLQTPGTYESWYKDNKDRWRQPRRSSQYWNGQQGKRPGQTAGSWDYVKGQLKNLGGSTNVRTGAQDIRNYQRHVPGMGEDYAARNASYFTRPGESEQFYDDNKGYFTTPGQGESWVRGNMGGFEKPGVAEGNYGNAKSALAGGAQNTLSYFKDTSPYAQGQSLTEDEFGYFSPQLRDKSYTEQMYESGTGGLIDPYARAQEKQTRNIRNAAAARGQFRTGASLRAEEELGADIAASEARDRIALGRSADEMRLGRAGAAQQFSSAAEDAMLGRRGFGLDAATSADASTRENVGMETDAAKTAQDAAIDRLFKGGTLSLEADDRSQNRMRLGADTADKAQGRGIQRVTSGMDVAGRGQDLEQDRITREVQRILDASGLDIRADELDADILEQLMRGAGQVDDQYNADTQMDFNNERLLDQDDLTYLESEGNAALTEQNTSQSRLRGGLHDIQGVATEKARTMLEGLDAANRQQFETQLSAIELDLEQGRISAQQAQSRIDDIMKSADLILKAKGK